MQDDLSKAPIFDKEAVDRIEKLKEARKKGTYHEVFMEMFHPSQESETENGDQSR